jgi:hypothetical protein
MQAGPEPEPVDADILDDALDDIRAEQLPLEELAGPPDSNDEAIAALIDDPRRGDRGLSARSRTNMRRLFVALPWELVGPYPALISLTYPKV